MIANVVNAAAVLAGGFIGLLIGSRLKERFSHLIMQCVAMCVCVIGVRMAVAAENLLVMLLSVVIGGVLGELIGIEKGLERLGERMQRRTKSAGRFGEGFVTATLLFCVGSMAVTGAIAAGIQKDYTLIFFKSIMDGVTALTLAASMGVGVLFSAAAVLLYQGIITLAAAGIAPLLSEATVAGMSAVGGVLVLAIGFNMLGFAKIKTGNLLPAIFIPLGLVPLFQWLSQW